MIIYPKLQAFLEEQEKTRDTREKKTFWASESETDAFEIYHKWIGTPPTNPIEADSLLKMDCGKRIEDSICTMMKNAGMTIWGDAIEGLEWLEKEGQFRFDLKDPVPVSGKIDAVGMGTDMYPIEVKSFYGYFQTQEITKGKPKSSYMKQLALYMHAMKKQTGLLLYFDRSEIAMYEFILRNENGIYKAYWYKPDITAGYNTFALVPCGLEFKVEDILERWKRIYEENVLPKKEPVPEFRYKYSMDEIEAKAKAGELYKSQMQKALSGEAVLGDWQVKYSPFKNLYIEREGDCLGYTSEEKDKLRKISKNYF